MSAVFVPGEGWREKFEVSSQYTQASLFSLTIQHSHGSWTRHFTVSQSSPVCLDYLSDEKREKEIRIELVEALIDSKLKMLLSRGCPVKDLLLTCRFTGHQPDGDGYNQLGSSIAWFRKRFGLAEPLPEEPVYYVRIVRKQATALNWTNALVDVCYQDPVITMREGLLLDYKWYADLLLDHFVGDHRSLVAVMCGKKKVPVCSMSIPNTFSPTHDLPSVPDYVHRFGVCLHERKTLPRGMCLLGSLKSAHKATHFYCPPQKCYCSESLEFCEQLSRFNKSVLISMKE